MMNIKIKRKAPFFFYFKRRRVFAGGSTPLRSLTHYGGIIEPKPRPLSDRRFRDSMAIALPLYSFLVASRLMWQIASNIGYDLREIAFPFLSLPLAWSSPYPKRQRIGPSNFFFEGLSQKNELFLHWQI